MLVVGIDIGTTTISAAVINLDTGKLQEVTSVENNTWLAKNQKWEALQDPEEIYTLTEDLLSQLKDKYGNFAALGLTGQMHGILYTNAQGQAVSPLYTWQDGRGARPLSADKPAETYALKLSQASGYKLATGFGSVTHYYQIHHKELAIGAVSMCTIHAYIGMRLTSRSKPLLHTSDAASIGIYRLESRDFDRAMIQSCQLDPSFFPQVTAELVPLGETASGTPVIIAVGDNQASFMGTIRDMEDSLAITIGTSGQISLLADKSIRQTKLAADLSLRPLYEDKNILVGAILCGGKAYALLESMFRSVLAMAGLPDQRLYEQMNKLAASSSQLDEKLLINTRFDGSRLNPAERASIEGLSLNNFDAAHLVVGILEGMAEELYNYYELMQGFKRQSYRRIVGAGNALRRNLALQRILSEHFGLPLVFPKHQEEAAFGAALCAISGAKLTGSLEEAAQLIHYD